MNRPDPDLLAVSGMATTNPRPWPGLDPKALYWGEDGRIGCASHTPFPGTDTWRKYRWERMPDDEIADPEAIALLGGPAHCEVCGFSPAEKETN